MRAIIRARAPYRTRVHIVLIRLTLGRVPAALRLETLKSLSSRRSERSEVIGGLGGRNSRQKVEELQRQSKAASSSHSIKSCKMADNEADAAPTQEELVDLLVDGARYDDMEDVNAALQAGVDVNAKDEGSRTGRCLDDHCIRTYASNIGRSHANSLRMPTSCACPRRLYKMRQSHECVQLHKEEHSAEYLLTQLASFLQRCTWRAPMGMSPS